MEKKKLGIVGSGRLGKIVAKAWKDGYLEDYELIYIASGNSENARKLAEEVGCKNSGGVEELIKIRPDFIAETASIQFLKEYAADILRAEINLAVLSVGAFADRNFYEQITEIARENHVHVYISNGVVGGFDILRTFRLLGDVSARFRTHKGPESLRGTALFDESLMLSSDNTEVFDGTASEIIQVLPTKVNVAVASSLAASSPDETRVRMVSVPGMTGDDHKMVAEVDGNRAVIDIYTKAGSTAAWGMVATLQNILSPVVFC